MADLGFLAFDADHHYYEAEDAFIRHVPRALRKRCMQWAVVDGKKRLLVGGKINRFIPNPTFDPVAKPGILDEYFRGRNPEGKDIATLFGELEPISPAYRNRDAKLALLDAPADRGLLPVPDARRRHGGVAEARPRGPARRLPRLQPLAGGGLGLRLPRAGSSRRPTSRWSTRPGRWRSSSAPSSQRRARAW